MRRLTNPETPGGIQKRLPLSQQVIHETPGGNRETRRVQRPRGESGNVQKCVARSFQEHVCASQKSTTLNWRTTMIGTPSRVSAGIPALIATATSTMTSTETSARVGTGNPRRMSAGTRRRAGRA